MSSATYYEEVFTAVGEAWTKRCHRLADALDGVSMAYINAGVIDAAGFLRGVATGVRTRKPYASVVMSDDFVREVHAATKAGMRVED